MIRLFIIFILFLLTYFIMGFILEFDALIKFTIASYSIEITLFTFLLSLTILILIVLIIMNIISYILNLPKLIKEFFLQKNDNNQRYKLMETLFLCLTNDDKDNKHKKLKNNLDNGLLKQYEVFYKFINANFEQDPIIKITKFKELEHTKIFLSFSLRKLMQIFYDLKNYKESIIYASRLYAMNERDIEALNILTFSYASLKLWKDFLFFAKKRLILNNNDFNDFLKYYMDYIQSLINNEEKEEEIDNIKYFLQYFSNNVQLLELYCELSNNENEKIKILQEALKYNDFDKIIKLYENYKK